MFKRFKDQTVVVAMSGGVDSSVSALMLNQAGVKSLGISMQVWDYRNNGGSCSRATCCSPDDFSDARLVASRLNIPYYVFDFEKTFKEQVIDRFVSSYEAGITPNPCIECNNKVKFKSLRERAKAIGCSAVATGHYAQIKESPAGFHLLRGRDQAKDQSYFLYGINQEELSQTLFPVGHLTKPEVREIAREFGLPTHDKPESQDICFVSGSVDQFLVTLGTKRKRGEILKRDGTKVGQHDGVHQFTVGQRRGLKIGGSEQPLYVIEIDSKASTVYVGEKSELERQDFLVSELNWVAPTINEQWLKALQTNDYRCIAQLRHRHKGIEVSIKAVTGPNATPTLKVSFCSEWSTVSPGQACVFYDPSNTEVIAGGKILAQSL